MAEYSGSAKKALDKLNDQLTCPICLDQYKVPKLLQCFHVFCEKCLEPVARQTPQGGQVVECPNCRHITALPQEGVSGLRGAFLIHHLFDIQDILKKVGTPSGTKCVKCEKRDPTCFCRSCGFLCDTCKKPHCEWKEFSSHELVSLDQLTEDVTNLVPPLQKILNCSKHPTKELDLYCETCKEVICRDCIVRLHRDHQYDLVSDVFQQQKEVLVSSVEPAEQQLASVGKALEDLKSLSGKITGQQQSLETQIRAEIRLSHQALEAREEVLITQLDQMTREKLKNVAAQQEQLELVATRLQSCCGFFRETLRTGSQIEVLAMAKPFVQQVRDVMSSLTPESLVPQEKADLDFASSQRELGQICKQFGEVYNPTICPPKCIAEGVGLRFAVMGKLAVATLKTVDQKGREYRHPVEVSLAVVSSDGSTGEGESKRMGGSRYVIGYLPWHGGLNYLHIRVEGEHISGSPFPVSVITDTPTIIAGVTQPWGSALDKDGQLVVSEFGKHCLSVFSSDGQQKKSFGTFGSGHGQLNHPCGVAFSAAGDILVADQFNHRIQVFSPEGKSVKCVDTKGNGRLQFNCPVGITVHPGSKKLYVADSDNNRVHVRNADLTFCSTFGSEGVGIGQFNNPLGVGFDAAGNLYVTDSDNHRVQVFTENGEYIRQFGKKGTGAGELCMPRGVAIDSNNIVYIGDLGNHRISIFSGEGEFLGIGGDRGSGPGQFKYPCGVTISSHGCIYVSDRGNNRIQVF